MTCVPTSRACPGPMLLVHAACGVHCLYILPVRRFMCVPHTCHTLHVCVWVKTVCSTRRLCVRPGTPAAHQLACPARVASKCTLPVWLQVTGAWDTLQRCVSSVAHVCTSRTLADGLDLPNASRTNKTFRSGLARGARRQASAELLQAWMAWAGRLLCCQLPAAPSPSFFHSRVPSGQVPMSFLHPLLQTSSSGGKVRKVGCLTPAAWESQTEQGRVKLAQQGGEGEWENRKGRKVKKGRK